MNGFLDTIVWLANFPATHGYAMVFIAAFGGLGLITLTVRGFFGGGGPSRLQQLRVERGEAVAASRPRIGNALSRLALGILSLVVLAGGAIGLISLIVGPITAGYIYEHGEQVTAEKDDMGDHVIFTASDGRTYTLPHNFFTSPSYPGDDSLAFAEQVVVRYLPGHPQAYVLDTEASIDAIGDPLGD